MTFKLSLHGGWEWLIWELKDQANICVSKTQAERAMFVIRGDWEQMTKAVELRTPCHLL